MYLSFTKFIAATPMVILARGVESNIVGLGGMRYSAVRLVNQGMELTTEPLNQGRQYFTLESGVGDMFQGYRAGGGDWAFYHFATNEWVCREGEDNDENGNGEEDIYKRWGGGQLGNIDYEEPGTVLSNVQDRCKWSLNKVGTKEFQIQYFTGSNPECLVGLDGQEGLPKMAACDSTTARAFEIWQFETDVCEDESEDRCEGMESPCVDTNTNNEHCGACETLCDTGLGEGAMCMDGQCVCAAEPYEPCGGQPGETCCGGDCVDLDTSLEHCGRCGEACTGAIACCFGDCVADFSTDEIHCGSCGQPCKPGDKCCEGACVRESSFLFDNKNCGDCGVVCEARERCVEGECTGKV